MITIESTNGRTYAQNLAAAVKRVTPEQVQKIKSMMLGEVEGVRTVGDISRAMQLDLMIVSKIITRNMEKPVIPGFKKEWE